MNNKTIFLILILFCISCSKTKQNKKSELKNLDKVSYLINTSQSKKIAETKKLELINQAYDEIIKIEENNEEFRNNLFKISYEYYKLKQWKKFDKSSIILLKKSKIKNDSVNLAKSYRYRAGYYKNNQNFDSSFYYYLKCEKLYKLLAEHENYATVLLNKGIVQYSINDFLGADVSLFQSYNIFKNSDDKQKLFETLVMIGLVSFELKDYKRSIEYNNLCLETIKKYNLDENEFQKEICLNNLGLVYQNMKDYSKAIFYYKTALKGKKDFKNDPELYSLLIDNLAYSKLKLNDYKNLPTSFYESLKIRDSLKNTSAICLSYIHLSEYYHAINDSINSLNFSNKALSLAKKSGVKLDLLSALKQSASVDKKNASKHNNDYIRINDSLQLEERKSRDRFARIQLETDEIIQKNSELEVKNRNLVFFLFGIGGIFSLLYVVRTQKMRNRELAFKQEQQESNRQIYNLMISQQENLEQASIAQKKQMAQELHDGILSKMFGTRMNLDSLNEAHDEASINIRYNYIQDLKTIEQEIREISHGLSSEKEKLINNFVNIVINLLEEQQKTFASNLVYSIDKEISWEKLDNTAKINLYRILQESLQNINKYANATTIEVSFTQINETIVLKIEDDGSGFDLAKKKKGIGLKNMISRTEESKGTYEIISEIGKGTFTTVSLPLITPTQTA